MEDVQPSPFGRRLRELREKADLTQEELGIRAGMRPQVISRLEGGGREPRRTTVAKLARALGCPTDAFYAQSSPPTPPGKNAVPDEELMPIPLLGELSAGRPAETVNEGEMLHLAPVLNRPGLASYRVRGDSMTDAGIRDGDYIVVREQPVADSGEIVVASVDGEMTLKRLQRRSKKEVWLMPANGNGAHKPIRLEPDRDRVLGVLVSVIRMV